VKPPRETGGDCSAVSFFASCPRRWLLKTCPMGGFGGRKTRAEKYFFRLTMKRNADGGAPEGHICKGIPPEAETVYIHA